MRKRNILRIRPKWYEFKSFFRRKEQSPFPTFPLINCTYPPDLAYHRKLLPGQHAMAAVLVARND